MRSAKTPLIAMEQHLWLIACSVLTYMCKAIQATGTGDPCENESVSVCEDMSACFDDSQRCDGIEDCADNSDEIDCDQRSWFERNMWNLIIILPVTLIGLCAVIASLCACIRLKRKRKRDIAKLGEEGQTLQAMEGGSTNPMDRPEGFTLATDGNSLWAGHPEYFYND